MEGLISKKGEFKPKCDKPKMALSQIWDKTKHGLRDWIISHLGLAHLRWRRRANFGLLVLHLFKFLCGSSKENEGKRRGNEKKSRFGTLIFVSMEFMYGNYMCLKYLNGNPSLSRFG